SLVSGGPATLTLSQVGDTTAGPSDLGVTTTLLIQGPTGNNGLTLANSGAHRLFYVSATGNLTLNSLTVSGGPAVGGHGGTGTGDGGAGGGGAGLGGAVFVNGGSLTVVQSTLTGNLAQGGNGGAINTGVSFGGGGGGGGLGGSGGAGFADGNPAHSHGGGG